MTLHDAQVKALMQLIEDKAEGERLLNGLIRETRALTVIELQYQFSQLADKLRLSL